MNKIAINSVIAVDIYISYDAAKKYNEINPAMRLRPETHLRRRVQTREDNHARIWGLFTFKPRGWRQYGTIDLYARYDADTDLWYLD